MSRGELDKIQARLKVAIQSHQILVAKMKSDPRNAAVQKQLHEIQEQITSLSEKQKSIVQNLRKELVQKPNANGSGQVNATNQPKSTVSVTLQSNSKPNPPTFQQIVTSKIAFVQTTMARPQPVLAPKPVVQNSEQVLLQGTQPKVIKLEGAKSASEVLMQNKAAAATASDNNNKGLISAIKPTDRSTPAVKIPQVHANRPSILQGGSRIYTNKTLHSSYVPVSARRGSEAELNYLRKATLHHETATPEERKKLEFMASLDLITPDTLKELQNKRSERKRRSTANPQFSYGNFEPESDVHEDFCAVCGRIGELLMCDTCNLVYHLGCLEPPLSTIPQGLWSCPKCKALNKQTGTNWSGTLAFVRSYISHKAAKKKKVPTATLR